MIGIICAVPRFVYGGKAAGLAPPPTLSPPVPSLAVGGGATQPAQGDGQGGGAAPKKVTEVLVTALSKIAELASSLAPEPAASLAPELASSLAPELASSLP